MNGAIHRKCVLWKPRLNAGMVKYWKSTRRSVQSKIKINNPQKAELQIATLLFLYPFSGNACGIYHLTNRQRTVWERSQQ